MVKTFLALISLSIPSIILAQNNNGYWDKDRATTREQILSAGSKTWLRTDELPIGTTEIVYRITLIDEDQNIADGLATALTLVPDPSGISKGTALAISLMSKMSGSDTCYYSIFSKPGDANNYLKTGDYKTACLSYPNPITKEVNRIAIQNSACIDENTRYLWFGFKNTNLIESEKIVLEVVPWVDNKAARGWTNAIKTKILTNCKNDPATKNFENPEEYCLCIVNKLETKFKLQEYQKLIPEEQNKAFNEIGTECLSESGEIDNFYQKQRQAAGNYIANKQYSHAIAKYLEIIENTQPELTDYNNLGYCYILTKQYLKAIKYLKEGEKLDEADLTIKGNLAHAYLLNGDVEIAKSIYLKYKSQNINETQSWADMVKIDFEDFNKVGILSNDFATILQLINNK